MWRRIWIFVAAGIVMAASSGAYLSYLDRVFAEREKQAIESAEVSAAQLAYAMAEHTSATIRQIDFVLRGLTRKYMDDPADFPASVQSAIDSFPALVNVQVTVVGADGTVLYSSHPNWKSVSAADREYFTHLRDGVDTLFVGHPVVGKFSGQWYLQFARRAERNSAFAGVVVMSVDPEYISQILGSLIQGSDDSAGLVLVSDGSYLARNRDIRELLGKKVKPSRGYLSLDAGDSGVFIDSATYEPVRRVYVWRRLQNLPLVVFFGLSEKDILQPIKNARFNSFVQNGILLGILVPAGFALIYLGMRVTSARQRLAESEALYRHLFERNVAIKMLVDPSDGSIVEVNPAACKFYGYSRQELLHMNISQINCQPRSEIMLSMGRAKNGECGHFLFPHRLASGEVRRVEVYSGNVTIDGRHLLYSIIHDITEQETLAKRLKDSETRYRMLFTAMPDGLIVTQEDGTIVEWNAAALSILHVNEEGLKERTPLFLPTGESLPKDQYPTRRALVHEETSDLYAVETPSGERRWIYINSRRLPPMGETGEVSAVAVLSDMTHVIALEESALISQSVFDVASEALLVTRPDFSIILVNPAFCELTGHTRGDILDHKLWEMNPLLFPADMESAIAEDLRVRRSWSGDLTLYRKNGSPFTAALRVAAVYSHDDRLLRYVALFSDVTQKKQQEKEMWQQANFDALTGLPNRTLLYDRIRQALAQTRRQHQSIGILFIDLDRFKPVNDTYGHAAGDILLKQVAQRILDCVRAGDTVARVGGDEFVILLPMVEFTRTPHVIAERILEAINRPFHVGDATVMISASIGITLSHDADHIDGLLKRADDAMYQAKKSGNGNILTSA